MNSSHEQFHGGDGTGGLPTLSADDRRLLDALIDHGFEVDALEALSPSDKQRVQKLTAMFQLLEDYPVEDADDALLDATMARINRYEQSREDRMKLDPQIAAVESNKNVRKRFLRVPLPDFITVAAVFLIAAGLGWPVLTSVRQRSLDAECSNNMRMTGIGFQQYAADYNNTMPTTAQAGFSNVWSSLVHNVVNLQPLVDGGYCQLGHLNCPGHKGDVGESFSYQWQSAGQPMQWQTARTQVVLGDRNPLIDAVRRGSQAEPLTLSLNHGGRGQNVLWTDGSTVWLSEPIVGRDDNIWLPEGAQQLIEGITTRTASDAFLAH